MISNKEILFWESCSRVLLFVSPNPAACRLTRISVHVITLSLDVCTITAASASHLAVTSRPLHHIAGPSRPITKFAAASQLPFHDAPVQ